MNPIALALWAGNETNFTEDKRDIPDTFCSTEMHDNQYIDGPSCHINEIAFASFIDSLKFLKIYYNYRVFKLIEDIKFLRPGSCYFNHMAESPRDQHCTSASFINLSCHFPHLKVFTLSSQQIPFRRCPDIRSSGWLGQYMGKIQASWIFRFRIPQPRVFNPWILIETCSEKN